ncbi:hypothetical protein QMI71_004668 [Salmonella enterica]|nr:hypothetical protein [Salmonella enterica]
MKTISQNYNCVNINGRFYTRSTNLQGETYYSVICKGGVIRTLKTPAIIAKIDAEIKEAAHEEALYLNENFDWEKVTPAQKDIHNARVLYGIEMRSKYNEDSVIDACHLQALKNNEQFDNACRDTDFFNSLNNAQRSMIIEKAHNEALEQDVADGTFTRVVMNAAQEYATAFDAFWTKSDNMKYIDSCAEWLSLMGEALDMNKRLDEESELKNKMRDAVEIANKKGYWITAEQIKEKLKEGDLTAEQLALLIIHDIKTVELQEQYAAELVAAQVAYNAAQIATVAALDNAVKAGCGDEGNSDTESEQFQAYEASESKLMEATAALLLACGRYSVHEARRLNHPVADIEALKTMFMPAFTNQVENYNPGKRNELVAKALAIPVKTK